MELNEVVKKRRSIRKWLDKKIKETTINQLIKTAVFAPSSCNRQTVKFLVVLKKEDVQLLGRVTTGGIGFAHNASAMILVLVDLRPYSLPIERHTPYLDGAAAIQNLLLKAYEMGLGACWLNWTISRSNEKKVNERFNIPKHLLPISLIALGYPRSIPDAPARKKISDSVVFDSF